jgi:uncharacterized protein YodC (DUF2158 family)
MNLRGGLESKKKKDIKVGDIVYLKGLQHRPLMYVTLIDPLEGKAQCKWFTTSYECQTMRFELDSLEMQEEPTSKELKYNFTFNGIILDEMMDYDFASHLVGGSKIEAIKLVRHRSGAGLKEAKDFVEAIPEVIKTQIGVDFKVLPF